MTSPGLSLGDDRIARYGNAVVSTPWSLEWRGLEDGLARDARDASLGIARLGVTCVVVTCGVAQSQGVRMIPRGDHGACIIGSFLWFSDTGHFLEKWWFGPLSGIMARLGFKDMFLWAKWVFWHSWKNYGFMAHVHWFFFHAYCLSFICFYLVVFGFYLPAAPFLVP